MVRHVCCAPLDRRAVELVQGLGDTQMHALAARQRETGQKRLADQLMAERKPRLGPSLLSDNQVGPLGIVDMIEEMEKELGRPIVSTNIATYWYALRQHGISDVLEGFGQLARKTEIAD